MNPEDFEFFASFLRERSGISLDTSKAYLVEARMTSLMNERGCESLTSLVAILRGQSDPEFEDRVVDEMMTNETSFLRDVRPFEVLRDHVLPSLVEKRHDKELCIWSAGCSSGQEPYSIAITLLEHFPQLDDWNVQIIGTDISSKAIAQACDGSYSQLEINRGLPPDLLEKHFSKDSLRWRINPEIRAMVDFRRMNLLEVSAELPLADVVFIRNVLLYFDIDLQRKTLGFVRQLMKPDSFLFLGNTETTLNIDEGFERIEDQTRSGCYRLEREAS